MVIVDSLTKSAHFIHVKSTYTAEDYARIYIKEIVNLHWIPLSIISDRVSQFTCHFWKGFQNGLGTQVKLVPLFIIRWMFKRNVIFRPLRTC